LDQTEDGQENGAPHADTGIGRHQAHRKGGKAGHQQRRDQCLLAPNAVAEVTENRRADRACEIAHEVDAKSLHYADQRIRFWEKELAENQRSRLVVELKIVPFDRGPDGAGNHGATKLCAVIRLRQWA